MAATIDFRRHRVVLRKIGDPRCGALAKSGVEPFFFRS